MFANDAAMVIQVQDTGIGIPEQFRQSIFEKFKQLDSSYQREYEGTGLGLALTQQLVEMHGGWIECESTVNVGTVFTVKLPRYPFSRRPETKASKTDTIPQPLGRIVLIDNHNESAHFVSEMLIAAGYQLVWMLEGLSAVTQIEMLQPSMVIIGTRLPDVDSREIIRALRQNPVTKRAKVLALASIATFHDPSSYAAAGADDILEYPIHPEELLDKVGHLLSRSNPSTLEVKQ
jgi:two-component system sensor histidine kinase/response regulator